MLLLAMVSLHVLTTIHHAHINGTGADATMKSLSIEYFFALLNYRNALRHNPKPKCRFIRYLGLLGLRELTALFKFHEVHGASWTPETPLKNNCGIRMEPSIEPRYRNTYKGHEVRLPSDRNPNPKL